jgi:Tfp pilus assembly protein PilW
MNALPIRSVAARLRQQGLTLVEMLVGMVLMLLVIMATVALFSVTSSSYRTVDAGQELEDNARFAFEIIGQAIRQAGFQERTGPPRQAICWPIVSSSARRWHLADRRPQRADTDGPKQPQLFRQQCGERQRRPDHPLFWFEPA